MTRAAEDAHDRLLDGLTEPEAAVHVAPLRDEYRAAIQATSATAIAADAVSRGTRCTGRGAQASR
jgi:hypothetical protein